MCALFISGHTDHARSTRYVKQDWEKLYPTAVLESDRSQLLQRIEDAFSGDEVWSRGQRLSPLLQQPCRNFPHALISARVRANPAGDKQYNELCGQLQQRKLKLRLQ